MTDQEIDNWIETDSLCFEAAKRGATFALQREVDLMRAFITINPQHRDALIAYSQFATQVAKGTSSSDK